VKAVVKTAPGVGHVEVCEIDEPSVPPGHVKIAVRAAGICGTDLHIYHDEFRSFPPVVLGHEVAGDVVEVGPGVENVRIGERVTTETYVSTCGRCHACRAGRVNLCPERRSIGSGAHGGFTSYLVVPGGNIHSLPKGTSYLAGALTEPLACVVHGALELPRVTPGDIAVVSGPGTIGLLTMQVVRAAGAPLLADANVFDVYRDPDRVGAGKVSLAVRLTYRASDRTLTDADVAAKRAEIVTALESQLGGVIRA